MINGNNIQVGPILGNLFPRVLKEAKVRDFFTLKLETLSAHEFRLKFTHLSRFAPEMVMYIWIMMRIFMIFLGRASSLEARATMLICDMDTSRLMVYT